MLFGVSLYEYLTGSWTIDRQIADRQGETCGSFTGEATFSAADDGTVLYGETGDLLLGGQTIRASQSHLWRFTPAGATVAFGDGRAFHEVTLDGQDARAIHDCPPDFYRVHYHFETPERWRQRWIVTGPRKDYTLESLYTRLHRRDDPVQCPPDD